MGKIVEPATLLLITLVGVLAFSFARRQESSVEGAEGSEFAALLTGVTVAPAPAPVITTDITATVINVVESLISDLDIAGQQTARNVAAFNMATALATGDFDAGLEASATAREGVDGIIAIIGTTREALGGSVKSAMADRWRLLHVKWRALANELKPDGTSFGWFDTMMLPDVVVHVAFNPATMVGPEYIGPPAGMSKNEFDALTGAVVINPR